MKQEICKCGHSKTAHIIKHSMYESLLDSKTCRFCECDNFQVEKPQQEKHSENEEDHKTVDMVQDRSVNASSVAQQPNESISDEFKQEKIKEILYDLYFGNYALEDLKALPSLKKKYLIEHINKMIDTLEEKYLKYGVEQLMFRAHADAQRSHSNKELIKNGK